MRDSPLALRHALSRRLLPLVYALAVVVGLILALTWLALKVQVSLAGFLNGESVWSKAQKEAVIALDAYAASGNPQAYAKFEHAYALLESDRAGRDALKQPSYSEVEVDQAFARGDVMPSAKPGMILIIRHLAWAPYVAQALSDWRATDAPLAELNQIADELHAAYAAGPPMSAEIARQRASIRAINTKVAPLSSDFSLKIAQGAEWYGNGLFFSVLGAACLACMLWLWMARRVLAGIRGSEERYRLLFDSAPDAIVMIDEHSGCILDANRTASAWTGHPVPELVGTRYADLFVHGSGHPGPQEHAELQGANGSIRPVEPQSSMTLWGEQRIRQAMLRDISERIAHEHARRVASKALASIAEGVIIADAERRVLSMNVAATRLTGFTAETLTGMRLGATRGMADGGPLPAAIWDEVIATHHWSGEVQSRRRDGSVYAERLSISTIRDADDCVQHFVAVFSDISVAMADRRRLELLAEHDALTGLANRAAFQRQCDAAIKQAALDYAAVVVLFIDLDAFKFVNDSFTHAVGDHLLKLVGERIQHQLREGEITGRIGGDEFTVLLPHLTLREDAAPLAGRLLSVLAEPFLVNGYEIVLSASIGIAGYPLDGDDATTLIANADAAMYVAKAEERNAWRFYVPMMHADARQRMLLAAELRQALQGGQFRLVYQPSVEMRSGRVVGVEALLRWQHPERGEVMPSEFVPIAESIGLIHLIDEWVMHATCAQIHVWDQMGMPEVRVAINVSARWFGHPGFVASVRRALQATSVAPARIVLEITEGAMLRLGEETEHTMQSLQALGIGVAIDDFGTGYASMAYLKLPAVAYLKIDRSFVIGLPGSADDVAITKAILAMAGSLGLTAIAEGIETEAQHECLLQAGCVEGQGYLYAYPVPAQALENMLLPEHRLTGPKLRLIPSARR